MAGKFESFVHDEYKLLENRLQAVSEFLWSNPELSREEFRAHDFLTELLDGEGFTVKRHYLDLPTAFRASFEAVPGQWELGNLRRLKFVLQLQFVRSKRPVN